MKVLVLGGDGFCGWPTALHLSNIGHEVFILDNLSRRNIDIELGCESLTPIKSIGERIEAWDEISGNKIQFINRDIANDYDNLLSIINRCKPNAIIHFAEQRAAPYSMKSSKHKRYTVENNISATNNLLAAVVESTVNPHIVHLGSFTFCSPARRRSQAPSIAACSAICIALPPSMMIRPIASLTLRTW